eukprot:3604943-Pleurochrysis_carterae.AAC.1
MSSNHSSPSLEFSWPCRQHYNSLWPARTHRSLQISCSESSRDMRLPNSCATTMCKLHMPPRCLRAYL